MESYRRPQFSGIRARLAEKPERLTIISGARQCGKTTLISQVLESVDRPWRYVAVDDPNSSKTSHAIYSGNMESEFVDLTAFPLSNRDDRWLTLQWESARKDASRSENGSILVLDEIQKIPNWSETVKGLWDADRRHNRRLHVVLLGSSPLLMLKGMSENLTGRFEIVRLPHWSYEEMSAAFDFNLDQFVFFGGYPGAASLIDDEQRWRNYICNSLVETNIERDVLAMQRVDKPVLLKQLIEICSVFSGQELSYTKMLGQLQDAGNVTTLARYLQLLTDIGLIAGLSKFSVGAHRRRASSPKLNVLNSAIMSAYSKYTFQEVLTDRSYWGRMVESAVGAHLLNSGESEIDIHYWRHNNQEVDFVLRRGQKVIAVEVKSGKQRSNIGGLKEFSQRIEVLRSIVVGRNGIPIQEFLLKPAGYWFE